eukprot:scaffold90318_cov30-Tisochrysis_lutea.AAC.2
MTLWPHPSGITLIWLRRVARRMRGARQAELRPAYPAQPECRELSAACPCAFVLAPHAWRHTPSRLLAAACS